MLAAGRGYGLRRAALSVSRCSRSTVKGGCRRYAFGLCDASARTRPGSGCLGTTSARSVRHRSESSAAVSGSLTSDHDGAARAVGLVPDNTETGSSTNRGSIAPAGNGSNGSSSSSSSSNGSHNGKGCSSSSSGSGSDSRGTSAGLQEGEWLQYQRTMQGRAGLLRRGPPTQDVGGDGGGRGHNGVGARGARFDAGARNASNTAPASRTPTTGAARSATAAAAAVGMPPGVQASDGRKYELGGRDDASSTAISSTMAQGASRTTPEWRTQRRQIQVDDASRQEVSRHVSSQRSGCTHGSGIVQAREMKAELASSQQGGVPHAGGGGLSSPQRGGVIKAAGAVRTREMGTALGGEQSLGSANVLAKSVEKGMEGRTSSFHGGGQRGQTGGSTTSGEEPCTPFGDEAPPISRLELLFGKPSVGGHPQQVRTYVRASSQWLSIFFLSREPLHCISCRMLFSLK